MGWRLDDSPTAVHTGSLRVGYAPEKVEGLRTRVRMNAASGSFHDCGVGTTTSQRHHIGGYTTWDMRADYAMDERISIYGRVENLFDKDYGQMAGFTNAGVAAYTGLRLKF